MSVASEIARLQVIKSDIRTALVAKGITSASTHDMADFAEDIGDIQAGGGEPALIPLMTGDTGEASASTSTSGRPAWNAFDGVTTTRWNATTKSTSQWIEYDFGYDILAKYVLVCPQANANGRAVKDYKVQGYKNGAWNDIATGQLANATVVKFDHITLTGNTELYSKYRFVVDSVWNTSSTAYAEICILQIIGTKPSN